MAAADVKSNSLEERLFTVHRRTSSECHIKIDELLCKRCAKRVCTYICPAEAFVWDQAESRIEVRYENCLECGTCWVACEMQAIEWSYPAWGAGISYKKS